MMKRYVFLMALTIAILAAAVFSYPVLAHRPYFEEVDATVDDPWVIDDPTISTAVYATLALPSDVDYFAFDGQSGQSILLEMTIPQIEGQEAFAPTMALFGPGLDFNGEPGSIEQPAGDGWLVLPPPVGTPPEFYEPFSRTSYWERQSQRVTLPANGTYVVAVWHEQGDLGRYTFVIGDKERLGGDLGFPVKLDKYWTPVAQPVADAPAAHVGCAAGH
jgi:hypothetical protein